MPKPPSAFWRTIRQSPAVTGKAWSTLVDGPWFGKVASPGRRGLVEQVDLVLERVAAPVGDEVGVARLPGGEPAWIPFVSGKSVPSNRACAIVAEGASDWKVSVRSTIGAAVPVPWSVTCQFACAWLVLPVNVPFAMSLQPTTFAPTCRHMWVVPCGVLEASLAVTVPARRCGT